MSNSLFNQSTQISISQEDFDRACANENFDLITKAIATQDVVPAPGQQRYNINAAIKKAIIQGKLELVKYLLTNKELKKAVNVEVDLNNLYTIACKLGHLEIVRFLTSSPELEKVVNILDAKVSEGLPHACFEKRFDVVKYLTSIDSFNNARQSDKSTFLYYGILHSSASAADDILQYLLLLEKKEPMQTDYLDHCLSESLLYASANGHLTTVKLLIQARVDIKKKLAKDDNDQLVQIDLDQAIIKAVCNNKKEVLEYLIFNFNLTNKVKVMNWLKHYTNYYPDTCSMAIEIFRIKEEKDLLQPNIKVKESNTHSTFKV